MAEPAMFRRFHIFPALLAVGVIAHAAPMTLKELDFLIRQRTPENEIVQLATQRRLVLPITPDFERNLRQSGATDSLLARLKVPGLSLSPEEMRVEAARAMANQARAQQAVEAVDAAHAVVEQRKQEAAAVNRRGGTMCRILNGELVKLDGDVAKPCDTAQFAGVRMFAFYTASMSSTTCRRFTPTLLDAYRRLKAEHPDFELILVSTDRDAYNMEQHMLNYRMPWPAVRFGSENAELKKLAGRGAPSLGAMSESGEALTVDYRTGSRSDPVKTLEEITQILAGPAPR